MAARSVLSMSLTQRCLSRARRVRTSPIRHQKASIVTSTTKQRRYSNQHAPREVSDAEIVRLASIPLHPLTLSDLVKYGRPPLSAPSLLSSARFTLSLLPPRLAHRLHAIRSLPYIVVSNPHINQIYEQYLHSLSTLLPFYEAGINDLATEAAFTDTLADLVQTHNNTIPTLALGLTQCSQYLGDGEGRVGPKFLDEHLRARIGTRLVAEQHIALHLASNPVPGQRGGSQQHQPPDNMVGIIDTALSPKSLLHESEAIVGDLCELSYGVRPSIKINGATDAKIAYIPMHLGYILTELLKNAFRATLDKKSERDSIEVTIAFGREANPERDDGDTSNIQATINDTSTATMEGRHTDTAISSSDGRRDGAAMRMPSNATTNLTIRIRDRGGGIPPEVMPQIWDYSFTTFQEHAYDDGLSALSAAGADAGGKLAGLGYGLPLGRAYAEYFGGELNVESLWGWGTDVHLRLKGLEMSVP